MHKDVVGIGGYMTAGKDVVADRLVSHHGYTKTFMSKPLLDMALTLNPYVPYQRFDDSKYGRSLPEPEWLHLSDLYKRLGEDYTLLKTNPEVRRFLQALGTDVGRNMIDQNLWVRMAEDNIEGTLNAGGKVVITGMRFENELNLIRDYSGTNLWVDRPGLNTDKNHASENSVSEVDFDEVVSNDGTLEDLYRTVDEWIAS